MHHFNLISHELRQIYGDARKAHEVAPELMFGVELIDVAFREASMPVKSAKVSTPWAHLPEHQNCIVLFCKDLGQPIIPSSPIGLCSDWCSVPSGKRYLVASGASILHLLQRNTRKRASRLADNISWSFQCPVIEPHQGAKKTRCRHLQFLKSGAQSDGCISLIEAVQAFPRAGFIFTDSTKLKKPVKVKTKGAEVGGHEVCICQYPWLPIRS